MPLKATARRLLTVLLLAAVPAGAVAQNVVTLRTDSTRRTIAPLSKLSVPVILDMSAAGGTNLASLTTGVSFGTSRLTFDSVRTAGFGSLTPNTTTAASGILTLGVFDAMGTTTTQTLATLYFTAASTGGTTVAFTPTVVGSDAGAGISSLVRTRGLDVCVASTNGIWGDVNGDSVAAPLGDGVVNIIDAQQIARYTVGLPVSNRPGIVVRGDVTNDGRVNIIDAQQIARFSVALSASARVNTGTAIPPVIASVTVSQTTASAVVGQSLQLNATPQDAAGNAQNGCAPVMWTTSSASVATVDSTGYVRALSVGSATIIASVGGFSATSTVTVGTVTTGVRLAVTSPRSASRWYVVTDSGPLTVPLVSRFPGNNRRVDTLMVPLPAGSGYRLRLLVADSASTSPDFNALVTAGGRVSGVNVVAGAMTPQSVVATALSAVVTTPDTVAAGGSVPFDLTLTDPSQFFSSTPYCASFSSAVASWATDGGGSPTNVCTSTTPSPTTVRYVGSAVAPSTAGSMFSQMAVWSWIDGPGGYSAFYFYAPSRQLGQALRASTLAAVTSVSVAPTTASVVRGATQQLTATIRGTGGVALAGNPAWTSSNAAVATVSATGLVTAVAYGAAVVTATAGGFTATSAITVIPAAGIRLAINSPVAASRWYVVVDSGTFVSPQLNKFTGNNRRADTLLIPLTAGSGYRLRILVADSASTSPDYSPLVTAGARISGVSVVAGPLTLISVTVTALSAVVSMPDTVAVSGSVSINVTLSDPSEAISPSGCAGFYSGSSSSVADRGGSPQWLCNRTTPTSASARYTGSFIAPSVAGALFNQFFFFNTVAGQYFTFLTPSRQLGQSLRSTAVLLPTTGVRLVVTSPKAASRWYVVADSGGLAAAQVSRFPGNNRRTDTLLVALSAGSGYRLRLLVADSASTSPDDSPLVTVGGRISGVSVAAGVLVLQSAAGTALSVVVNMADTVAAGSSVPVDLTLTDPSQAFSASGYCSGLFSGTAAWTTDWDGAVTWLCSQTRPSPTTVKYTGSFLAPTSAGTLFSQLSVFTLIAGNGFYFIVPSRQLGQPLRNTVVR